MRLFLSGGSMEPFILDKMFVDAIDKTKPLLYIPIAMDPKEHSAEECFVWMKNYFSKFNFSNIVMTTDLRKISEKDLDKFGGVYIGGGNTPFLLKELKDSGFYEHLKTLIEKDVPLAGGSAGAIIFAKTIVPSLSTDENGVKLKIFDSLDKLQGWDLDAHYEISMDADIRRYMKEYNLKKVIALPERCGLFVEGKKMKIIGELSAWIFDSKGKKEIRNGEELK